MPSVRPPQSIVRPPRGAAPSPPAGTGAEELGPGEVHVWALDLDAPLEPELRGRCEQALGPGERARAKRFPNALAGRRWALSRGLLRVLLGERLSVEPASLRFELGEHGKPRLTPTQAHAGDHKGDLRFNLAHSGPVAVYALAAGMEVGVDVEVGVDMDGGAVGNGRLRWRLRRVDMPAVAKRAFGATTARRLEMLAPEGREREFLRLWVRHEAMLKCLGVGLGGAEQASTRPQPWIAELDLWGGVAAVAADEAPARVV